MSKIQTTLQQSTIANMLAVELKHKGIPITDDEELKYNILMASAENILNAGIENDIHECINEIDEYICDTILNYPSYFMTGEE